MEIVDYHISQRNSGVDFLLDHTKLDGVLSSSIVRVLEVGPWSHLQPYCWIIASSAPDGQWERCSWPADHVGYRPSLLPLLLVRHELEEELPEFIFKRLIMKKIYVKKLK